MDFIKFFVFIYIFIMIAVGWIYSVFGDNFQASPTGRWEKIEEAGVYDYWRDREHPEVCTLHNVTWNGIFATEALTYVPCELILEDHD